MDVVLRSILNTRREKRLQTFDPSVSYITMNTFILTRRILPRSSFHPGLHNQTTACAEFKSFQIFIDCSKSSTGFALCLHGYDNLRIPAGLSLNGDKSSMGTLMPLKFVCCYLKYHERFNASCVTSDDIIIMTST